MLKIYLPLLALFFLTLTACSSQEKQEDPAKEEQAQEQATQECLDGSLQATSWGECNVQKTIYKDLPKLHRCVSKSAAEQLKGTTFHLLLTISEKGHVKGVSVQSDGVEKQSLNLCLRKELKKLKFAPPPTGSTPTISFPLPVDLISAKPNVN